jgi:hypothetical protein
MVTGCVYVHLCVREQVGLPDVVLVSQPEVTAANLPSTAQNFTTFVPVRPPPVSAKNAG